MGVNLICFFFFKTKTKLEKMKGKLTGTKIRDTLKMSNLDSHTKETPYVIGDTRFNGHKLFRNIFFGFFLKFQNCGTKFQ